MDKIKNAQEVKQALHNQKQQEKIEEVKRYKQILKHLQEKGDKTPFLWAGVKVWKNKKQRAYKLSKILTDEQFAQYLDEEHYLHTMEKRK